MVAPPGKTKQTGPLGKEINPQGNIWTATCEFKPLDLLDEHGDVVKGLKDGGYSHLQAARKSVMLKLPKGK